MTSSTSSKNDVTDPLLEPSLTQGSNRIYSSSAMFGVAFFGGMVGVILFAALNSYHLKRLKTDAIWIVLAILLAVATYVAFFQIVDADQARSNFRLVNRIGAFALFAAFWFLHRLFYRSLGLGGSEPLSPWGAAIACVLISMAVTYGVVYLGLFAGGVK